jgi:hypothetical protein
MKRFAGPGGRATIAIAALALAARHAAAQVEWGPPEDQKTSAVVLGVGPSVGLIGARYLRFLAPSPLSAWAGAGAFGTAAGLELSLPRIHVAGPWFPTTADGYVGLGIAQGYGSSYMRGGALLLEVGMRRWWDVSRTHFWDLGLGFYGDLWGHPEPDGPVTFRAQMGFTS